MSKIGRITITLEPISYLERYSHKHTYHRLKIKVDISNLKCVETEIAFDEEDLESRFDYMFRNAQEIIKREIAESKKTKF